jgi:hypothetical protein
MTYCLDTSRVLTVSNQSPCHDLFTSLQNTSPTHSLYSKTQPACAPTRRYSAHRKHKEKAHPGTRVYIHIHEQIARERALLADQRAALMQQQQDQTRYVTCPAPSSTYIHGWHV